MLITEKLIVISIYQIIFHIFQNNDSYEVIK